MWGVGVDPLAENQPLGNLTLHDLTKRWAPAVRAFLIGLARNGLSATPDEIPLSGFIAFLRFYTLLRRDSWIFSYMPADGGTSFIDPLVEKVNELGGKVVTLSDSGGTIYDPNGIDNDKLAYVMELKNIKRGRIKEYAEKYGVEYLEGERHQWITSTLFSDLMKSTE